MTEKENPPTVTIVGCDISNNRKHGIRAEGGAVIDVRDTRIAGNAKSGVSTSSSTGAPPTRRWYQRPWDLTIAVLAGLIVAYLAYRFGWAS